jgi:hypothetical protein
VKIWNIHQAQFQSKFADGAFIIIPGFPAAHETEDKSVVFHQRSPGSEVAITLPLIEEAAGLSAGQEH